MLRAVRRAHVAGLSDASNEAARAADMVMPHLTSMAIVAVYRATPDELSTEALALTLLDRGVAVALPRMQDGSPLIDFARWRPGDDMKAGPYGIPQPPAGAQSVTPDAIVTPLVGFDRQGGRLGQGAGCYDRAFAAYPDAWRIGYGWSVQEMACVPTDPWDIPLHAIATEREWIICGSLI